MAALQHLLEERVADGIFGRQSRRASRPLSLRFRFLRRRSRSARVSSYKPIYELVGQPGIEVAVAEDGTVAIWASGEVAAALAGGDSVIPTRLAQRLLHVRLDEASAA